jgi:hypothetical protein
MPTTTQAPLPPTSRISGPFADAGSLSPSLLSPALAARQRLLSRSLADLGLPDLWVRVLPGGDIVIAALDEQHGDRLLRRLSELADGQPARRAVPPIPAQLSFAFGTDHHHLEAA